MEPAVYTQNETNTTRVAGKSCKQCKIFKPLTDYQPYGKTFRSTCRICASGLPQKAIEENEIIKTEFLSLSQRFTQSIDRSAEMTRELRILAQAHAGMSESLNLMTQEMKIISDNLNNLVLTCSDTKTNEHLLLLTQRIGVLINKVTTPIPTTPKKN